MTKAKSLKSMGLAILFAMALSLSFGAVSAFADEPANSGSDPANSEPASETTYEPGQFADVQPNDWYYGVVTQAVKDGYMSGYAGTNPPEFGPNNVLTRAQAATILYNLAGKPSIEVNVDVNLPNLPSYNDIKESDYYAKAVEWLTQNNIVQGILSQYSDQIDAIKDQVSSVKDKYNDAVNKAKSIDFKPNEPINREQFVTMLAAYALALGHVDIPKNINETINAYPDGSATSEWALPSLGVSRTASSATMPI